MKKRIINKLVSRIAYKIFAYEKSEFVINDIIIYADFTVEHDGFKTVSLSDISVMNKEGDEYPNVSRYFFIKVGKELEDMNDDNEEEWLDTLTQKERQQYLKECYGG